jgi:Tfp pilus assembly protein PilO
MMKADSSTKTIVAILLIAACAMAFWMLLLSPKRKEADELATQAEGLQATLTQTQATVAEGEAARRDFPDNYRQLVVLGKAVPAGDETASLLVQTNRIADRAKVEFQSIELGTPDGSASTEAEATETTATAPAAATPTEAEAALLPIGASIGTAGHGVMPYDLSFEGSFFDVADFIHGIDSLVDAKEKEIAVDGRLVTLDGFSLATDPDEGFPHLLANFTVTTYVVPPSEGVTAGASPTEPETTETSETTEGVPSSSTEEAK